MNKHQFYDNAAASFGRLLSGKKLYFSRSIDSPSIAECIRTIYRSMIKQIGAGPFLDPLASIAETEETGRKRTSSMQFRSDIQEIILQSPVGTLDPAFSLVHWKGSGYPTILYHHGNNERPYDYSKTAKGELRSPSGSND